jgi:hypothetical protein
MTNHWLRDPVNLGLAGALLTLLGGLVAYRSLRKKPTEDDIERGRREYLLEVGRLIDGTVLDMTDIDTPGAAGGGWKRHVFYKYQIAGVSYECSQEVSVLTERMAEARVTPGMPASVRYDPHNPTNSIVVAESWSGLRGANPLGQRRARAVEQETAPATQ